LILIPKKLKKGVLAKKLKILKNKEVLTLRISLTNNYIGIWFK